jgi:hypothetical protein
MNQLMGELLSPRAEGEGWDQFGAGVGGDPPCRLPCGCALSIASFADRRAAVTAPNETIRPVLMTVEGN